MGSCLFRICACDVPDLRATVSGPSVLNLSNDNNDCAHRDWIKATHLRWSEVPGMVEL